MCITIVDIFANPIDRDTGRFINIANHTVNAPTLRSSRTQRHFVNSSRGVGNIRKVQVIVFLVNGQANNTIGVGNDNEIVAINGTIQNGNFVDLVAIRY